MDNEEFKVGEKRPQEIDKSEQYFMKDLYLITDIEPCYMCAMALTHSRIERVYFKNENKFDGAIIQIQLNYLKNINHQFNAFQIKN